MNPEPRHVVSVAAALGTTKRSRRGRRLTHPVPDHGWIWVVGAAIGGAVLGAAPLVALAQDGVRVPEPRDVEAPELPAEASALRVYLDALAERGLLQAGGGSRFRLDRLLRQGESLFFAGENARAAALLYEVVESPAFEDFSSLPNYRGAEFTLARALEALGAYRSAERVLLRILKRGPEGFYYAPAIRKLVDVSLASGDLERGVRILEATAEDADEPADDLSDELQYLRGSSFQRAGDLAQANEAFAEVGRRSRFHASAQYLRGVIATEANALDEAESLFCSVVSRDRDNQLTLFSDDRFYKVRDLARLGLGRVAHEGRRGDDAFYYYFQVPTDSPEVAGALFESAYAMYEGNDFDTAIDLLDQLDVRFKATAFSDEATLLRGYIHLARCEFEEARRQFAHYHAVFEPVREEVAQALSDPDYRQRLFEEILAGESNSLTRLSVADSSAPLRERDIGERATAVEESPLTAADVLQVLLQVDPNFYRLHRQLINLDAEVARAGRVARDLEGIRARLEGSEGPRAAEQEEDRAQLARTALRQDVARTGANLEILRDQLAQLQQVGDGGDASTLARLLQNIRGRMAALRAQLPAAGFVGAGGEAHGDATALGAVGGLLAEDERRARELPGRVADLRQRLVAAATSAAEDSLAALQERLSAGVRRAQIGTIDAVMGSKRRIEGQIESLAAGRFPPELVDPLRYQGLLHDDQEFWPFEGEHWTDEFDETDKRDEFGDDLSEDVRHAVEGDSEDRGDEP